MNKKFEEDFLNYLEQTLSTDESREFEQQLAVDKNLAKKFENYRQIVQMENQISQETEKLDEQFVSNVMAKIDNYESISNVDDKPSFLRKIVMKITTIDRAQSRTIYAGLATCAVMALCMALVYGPEYQVYKENQAIKSTSTGASETSAVVDGSSKLPLPLKALEEVHRQGLQLEKDESRVNQDALIASKVTPLESRTDSAPAGSKAADSEATDNEATANTSQSARDIAAQKVQKQDLLAKPQAMQRSEAELHQPMQSILSDIRKKRNILGGTNNSFSESRVGIIALPHSRGRERYQEVSENKPTLTSKEAMSTFSIDVDTGSYTNARRYLRSGQLPPAESVRIEEFINYFSYDYPHQAGKPFSVHFEAAPAPHADGKHLLKIGVKAQGKESIDQRKPWNLVFLVDVSGSMNSANKLPLVQKALQVLTNNMKATDTVSLVTYAGSSRTVLEPTGVSSKQKILQAIDSLSSGGGTHGSAGIHLAYQAAKDAFLTDGVNRVILATDGDFNVGVTDRNELIKLIEEKRKSGITLTTLGFGAGNYNEAVMEQIANKGNGNYFYIDSFQEARKVFETDLVGTVEVVAKDVKLQIEFNPTQVAQYRLIGYENRKLANQDFANDKIDAGEIGAGHTVTALYEIVLAGSDAAKALAPEYRYKSSKNTDIEEIPQNNFGNEFAFLKVRYKTPQGSKSSLLTFPLAKSDIKKDFSQASSDFRFVSTVSTFAHKLRKSSYQPEISFDEIVKMAESSKGKDALGYRREFLELVKNARSISQ